MTARQAVAAHLAGGAVMSTPRETVHATYAGLRDWALTLDRAYLEDALARVLKRSVLQPNARNEIGYDD